MDRQYIYEKLCEIKVINTHEHLYDESYRLKNIGDWSLLFEHYGLTTLKAAGMTDQESGTFYSIETPHAEKWEIFNRYFHKAKNTACIKSVLNAVKDIYGIDEITKDSMHELTQKMKEYVKPGFYQKVLRDMANIDFSLINCFDLDGNGDRYPARTWGDTELMRPDLFADTLIYPSGYKLMSRETGQDCSDLSGWLKAIDMYFEKYAAKCYGVKIALAYRGHIDFTPGILQSEVENMYKQHYGNVMGYADQRRYAQTRPLIDFLFFHVLGKAKEYGMPVKMHTGLYSSAFGNTKDNIIHLAKLAQNETDINFVAMHIAYPYIDDVVAAIRNTRNIFADMSWSWILDAQASTEFMKKALTAAPANKVMGFGGDYSWPENTYGNLKLARIAMASGLSSLVDEGYFVREEAVDAGKFLLRESALGLYRK